MRIRLMLSLLLLLLLAACGNAAPVAESAPIDLAALPLTVAPAQVHDLLDHPDVFLIDVREQVEYDAGHIPGVTLIPLGALPDRLSEVPQDKTVIMVCRSGNRSGQATAFLRQQGFENVHNMSGGILEWQQKGYAVER